MGGGSSLSFSLPHLRCFSSFRSSLLFPASLLRSIVHCVSVSPGKLCFRSPRKLFPTLFLPQISLFSRHTHLASLFIDKRQPQSKKVPHQHPPPPAGWGTCRPPDLRPSLEDMSPLQYLSLSLSLSQWCQFCAFLWIQKDSIFKPAKSEK